MVSRVQHQRAQVIRDQTTVLSNAADRRLVVAERPPMRWRWTAVAAFGLACLTWLGIPHRAVGQADEEVEEVPSTWGLVPTGLSGGNSFRLLFVSSTTRDARAADIATYDTHVQSAAAAGHEDIQGYSSHFKVLGSTSAADARDNTGTTFTASDPGVPIYWLDGDKVADDYSDFYDGAWDSNAPRDESGTEAAADISVWTGSSADGTGKALTHLGRAVGSNVRTGEPGTSGSELDSGENQRKGLESGFYALSGVFKVELVGPELSMASVDGTTLTLTYDVALDTNSVPEAIDFVVTVAGTERTVSTTAINGMEVVLELASAVTYGEAVILTYTPGTNKIQNASETAAAALTNQEVSNNTLPVLSVAPSAASEGDAIEFTVTLSPASAQEVTVEYETADGTATQGVDFTAAGGTLTFSASETEMKVSVATVEDDLDEGSESFPFSLSAPTNAEFSNGRPSFTAAGTILDDEDPEPVAVSTSWSLVPTGLSEGDTFRLLFVSSTTRHARSGAIGPNDTHVRTAADGGHTDIQDHSGHFRALVSVEAVDARAHTGTTHTTSDLGVPIYWLDGDKVADDYSDFYDGSWDSNAPTTESGTSAASNVEVFTGSSNDGTSAGRFHVGRLTGNNVRIGRPGTSGEELDSGTNRDKSDQLSYYALSGIFRVTAGPPVIATVVVEGATLTLTYGFDLDPDSVPAAGDFSVTVAGTLRAVTDVEVSGKEVVLTLSAAVAPGETVTLTYTPGDNPVQSVSETAAAALTDREVTNNTLPVLSVEPAEASEGDAIEFTVTLSPESAQEVTVEYGTADGTAMAGVDFTETSGTLTFSAGDLEKRITIATTDDQLIEENETFTLTLSSATNASFLEGALTLEATGTIADNDRPPEALVQPLWGLVPSGLGLGDSFRLLFVSSTIRDATAADIATYDMHVQSAAANGHMDIQPLSAHFKVLGSTSAVAARDNTSTTFTPSYLGVPIYWIDGDKVADDNSDFYDGSWDSNAPTTESGTAAASDISVWTGSSADGTGKGLAHLGRASGSNVRTGKPGTSGGELDSAESLRKGLELGFYALSGILTVSADAPPRIGSATVSGLLLTLTYDQQLDSTSEPLSGDFSVAVMNVPVSVSDVSISGSTVELTLAESVRPFQVVHVSYTPGTNPVQNTVGTGAAPFTNLSVRNVSLPVFFVGQPVATEGESIEFSVSLSPPSLSETVTLKYSTGDGTATEGVDFERANGTLSFAPFEQHKTITVATIEDELDEGSETFPLTLSEPMHATLSGSVPSLSVWGTILDDDEPLAAAVPAGWGLIPSGLGVGDSFRLLFVSSTARRGGSVAIGHYDTLVRTAAANGHPDIRRYSSHFRTVGSSAAVDARSHTATNHTPDEAGVPIYWLGGDKVADDYSDFYDGGWDSNTATQESGTAVSTSAEVFTGSSNDGTRAVAQYLGAEGNQIRIGKPGTSTQELDAGETRPGTQELGVYGLSGVFTVTAGALPVLEISEGSAMEGAEIEFTVTLSAASATVVTVMYETASGTAIQGEDFTRARGTLRFAADETEQTITVATAQDLLVESTEMLSVTLSAALNATLSGGGATLSAEGMILDDDILLNLNTATVDGAALTLAFSEDLNLRSVPSVDDFAVNVDAAARTVRSASVSRREVTLTLTPAVTEGQTVTASYTPGLRPIEHVRGTDVEPFADRQVLNLTPPAPAAGTDQAALVALFNATSGVKWTNSENWRTQAALDQWFGVQTDSDGRVSRLDLDGNGLSGVVPREVMDLTRLRGLSVAANETCVPGDETFSAWLEGIEFDGAICPTAESAIDIAVFYTPAAAGRRGGARFIETYIESLVAETNQIYVNSGVGIRLSIVLMEAVDYREGEDRLGTHRDRLRSQDDTFMDEVHAKRDQVGADMVHLVVVGPDSTARGVASQLLKVSPESDDQAFSVTTQNAGASLFAHELGHAMGIQHDRVEACNSTSCAGAAYPYGYGYVNQQTFEPGALNRTRWRTIMSYNTQCRPAGFSCDRIRRFSDPNSDFRGDPLGVSGDEWTIDLDGPADAVRSLNNARETIARYRRAVTQYEGAEGERFVASTWPLVPEGVPIGGSFRLMFVTSGRRNGMTNAIKRYDTHVQGSAAAGHTALQAYSSHFNALVSTSTIDARDHTGTNHTNATPGVPIYWLGGDKVADDYSDFYDGDWDSNTPRDESGRATGINQTFTGSNGDGTKFPDEFLGTTVGDRVRIGNARSSGDELDGGDNMPMTNQGAFYGLSGVFTVVRDTETTNRASLELFPAEVREDSGPVDVTVTVTLAEPELTDTEIELRVHDGTAASPDDFMASPRKLTVDIPAGETTGAGEFTITPVNESPEEPECIESVVLRGARASGTKTPLTFEDEVLAIVDPGVDAAQCGEPARREPATLVPSSPPNSPGATERGHPETNAPPGPATAALIAIWTDQPGYARGQPVRLYRSLDPKGDSSRYTFFYYLENIETGQRFYFAPGIGSSALEEDTIDHFGLSGGGFRVSTIKPSDKELIWAGGSPRAGSWHFAAEIRTSDASRLVKAAFAKFVVSSEAPEVLGSDGRVTLFARDKTWTRDTIYKLRQAVRVRSGATLAIEAGTLIQGLGPDAAIIVERGGKIEAMGTRAAPVVMTCDAAVGQREPGCWGGLAVLGAAPTSKSESASLAVPCNRRAKYGGQTSDDSSGALRFVRVEFAGGGTKPGAPVPALAFCGVGSATVVDHVQVHASLGDGIDFRGGAVHCRYCVSSDARDDSLQWSEGWVGTAQHVFLHQGLKGDRGIEASGPGDGSHAPGLPSLYNATLVGGVPLGPGGYSGEGVRLGAGAAVTARNLVLTGFGGYAIGAGSEAVRLFVDGRSSIRNAILHENGGRYGLAQTEEAITPYVEFVDEDPQLRNTRYEQNPDPRPKSPSVALAADKAAVPPSDSPMSQDAPYLGAFGAKNWLEEWTFFGRESDLRTTGTTGEQP